jgi:hypothetical protein
LRRWLFAITALLGLLPAIAVTAATASGERTFAATSAPVQLLMSVTLPFIGALLASDLHRSRRGTRPALMLTAAAAVAAGFALFGLAVSAVAVALAPSGAAQGRWQHAGAVVVGSLVVQLVAQSIGTGLGLLVRWPVLACLGTVVLPLGVWALLGVVDAVRPAQDWLTPFGSASHLLSGGTSPLHWVQEVVVVLLWSVGLNTAGLRRLHATPA